MTYLPTTAIVTSCLGFFIRVTISSHSPSRGWPVQMLSRLTILSSTPCWWNIEGHVVDVLHVLGREDGLHLDVAEEGQLGLDVVGQVVLRAAQQDVRLDTDLPQGRDTVLGRLRLHLARRFQEGHPGEVDEGGVLLAHIIAELSGRLEEGQPLDVAHGPADLDDGHVVALPRPGGCIP